MFGTNLGRNEGFVYWEDVGPIVLACFFFATKKTEKAEQFIHYLYRFELKNQKYM